MSRPADTTLARPARRLRPPASLTPLRTPAFRLLFAGQTVSVFGDAFSAVALPWLVFQLGGGARQLSAVVAGYGVCRLATTPVGGVLSDRLGAWRVMLVSDIGRLLLTGALAAVAASGDADLWAVGGLAAGIGLFAGLFAPAAFAITPSLLPAEQLQAGNALNGIANYAAGLAGPGLAGLAVAGLQPGFALGVDAVTFAVSAGCLLGIGARRPQPAGAGPAQPAGETAGQPGTFRQLLRQSRLLQVILVITAAANLTFGGVLRVALPTLASEDLGTGATGYGGLLAAFSGGCLAGGLLAAGLTGLRRRGSPAMLLGLAMAAAMSLVPFAGLAGALAALAVVGAASTTSTILALTLVQQGTPRHLLGRVMGAVTFAGLGLFPLSATVAGLVANRYGATVIFLASGVVLLGSFAFGLAQKEIRER